MAEIMNSLFGMNPQMLQQQRLAQDEDYAYKIARMSPLEQANFNIASGVSGLTRGIGGLLGAKDPELERMTMRNQVVQGLDPNDAEALSQAAMKLSQAGDTEGAMALSQRVQQLRATDMKTRVDQSTIAKNLREKEGSDPIQQLLRTGKFKPASISAYAQSGNVDDLEYVDTAEKQVQWDVKEVGVAEGTREPVYTLREPGKQPRQIVYKNINGEQQAVPYSGAVDRTTAKVSANANSIGESAFEKELGSSDAKRLQELRTTRDNSISTVNSLTQMSSLSDAGLIDGSFATNRVGLSNFLSTIGLASPADVKRLAASENYQKVSGDVILGVLGGKLGAGFSNEDRKFIQGLVPQLETSPVARRQLINYLVKKNQAVIAETGRAEDHAIKNRGFKGYVPSMPLGPTPAGRDLSGMSTEALKRAAGVTN